MSKETLYFSHDCNARNDRKLMSLRMKYGMRGVGVYWCIVEMLYEEGGYLPLEYERITFELREEENVLRDVINEFGLFIIEENKFYSESVIERLKERMEKSEKAKKSIGCRWLKQGNTNVLRTNNECNTKKKRKEKKRKEKNKEIIFPDWLPKETFLEFISMRKEKKVPLPETSFNRFFKKLKKLSDKTGNTPEEILDQSISSGWQGIFEVKNNIPETKEAWEV